MAVVGRHVKPPAGAKRGFQFSSLGKPIPGSGPQRSLSTPGPGQRIDPREYQGAGDVRHARESQAAETAVQRNPARFKGVYNNQGSLKYLNAVRARLGKKPLGIGRNPQ